MATPKKAQKKSPARPQKKSAKKAVKKPVKKSTKPGNKRATKVVKKVVKTAKKAPAKKLPAKASGKPAAKGRPFPKKNAPTPAAPVEKSGKAGKSEKGKPAAQVNPPKTAATASGSSAGVNDGFQRRLLLPPPPKVERKSKHALKPLRDIPTPLVVAGAENPWSKDELKEMKVRLTKDFATYKEELASAEAQAAELLQDSSDGAGDDQADAGTKTFEREHELSLVYNAQDLVLQTELALARIAAGTYTKCELCGNPIGKARLQVFPRATLCMLCKQKEERR
jgi:RNA polymerase-binding transcription factor DksA